MIQKYFKRTPALVIPSAGPSLDLIQEQAIGTETTTTTTTNENPSPIKTTY